MAPIVEVIDFTVKAPPELTYSVLADVESLPRWSATHNSVRVLSRDQQGLPKLVHARLGMIGLSDDVTFEYTFTANRCEWITTGEGSTLRSQGGYYLLEAAGPATRVRAELHIEPKVKLPNFVVRRAVSAVADVASKSFSKEVLQRLTRC
ncbi:SRPBCC family protein [Mycolicibacterium neoaurum]|uniref:SRPBCC family protein n=1 Tax=Mycolicibacterium neoaurum TaxID=1795 RepID=UPI001F4D200D|nr:SRPBCC family protein [Mycolicibacterium neoaurum]